MAIELHADEEHYLEMLRDEINAVLEYGATQDDINELRSDLRDLITTLDEHHPEEE